MCVRAYRVDVYAKPWMRHRVHRTNKNSNRTTTLQTVEWDNQSQKSWFSMIVISLLDNKKKESTIIAHFASWRIEMCRNWSEIFMKSKEVFMNCSTTKMWTVHHFCGELENLEFCVNFPALNGFQSTCTTSQLVQNKAHNFHLVQHWSHNIVFFVVGVFLLVLYAFSFSHFVVFLFFRFFWLKQVLHDSGPRREEWLLNVLEKIRMECSCDWCWSSGNERRGKKK